MRGRRVVGRGVRHVMRMIATDAERVVMQEWHVSIKSFLFFALFREVFLESLLTRENVRMIEIGTPRRADINTLA